MQKRIGDRRIGFGHGEFRGCKWFAAAVCFLAGLSTGAVGAQQPVAPLRWGVDDAGGPTNLHLHPKGAQLFEQFGFDVWVHHFTPVATTGQNISNLQALNSFGLAHGLDVIVNLEDANWFASFVDSEGYDWANRPDGRHYFMFPPTVLNSLSGLPRILGAMYDEPEHMQNWNNHQPDVNRPFMYDYPPGDTVEVAADRFTSAAAGIGQEYVARGKRVFTEHVFPIQFHTYARAGYTPATKILKETWCPLVLACAMGAAVEYGREFWATPDLWFWNTYPGHSPEEYRSALLMAYSLGVTGIYTENLAYNGSLVNMTGTDYTVTAHGDVTLDFKNNYVPAHPRRYTFSSVRPRVVIIRQEDSYWGQKSASFLGEQLFGNPAWKHTDDMAAWIQIWHVLSRGAIPTDGLTWFAQGAYDTLPYRVFAPLDGVVVYDQYAQKQHMEGAEVIFLTGIGVSAPSLQAVSELVSAGATCVTLPGLAPAAVLAQTGNQGVMDDGAGKWVVTESFLAPFVQPYISAVIPTGDYIRYRFGDTVVTLTPVDGNYNRLTAVTEFLAITCSDSGFIVTGEPVALTAPEGSGYQWFFDGNLLDGETARTLDLGLVEESDSGTYTCTYLNAGGDTVRTASYELVVLPPDSLPAARPVWLGAGALLLLTLTYTRVLRQRRQTR